MSYYHTERQRFLEPETTNIRVIDPTTHPCPSHACPPPCALPPPQAPFAAHYRHPRPLCSAPTAITTSNTIPPCRTCCLVSPAPSPPLRTQAPPLAYKTPHQLPQLPSRSKQSTHLIESHLPNRKQLHFPLPCS
jgi:hypothetical protein